MAIVLVGRTYTIGGTKGCLSCINIHTGILYTAPRWIRILVIEYWRSIKICIRHKNIFKCKYGITCSLYLWSWLERYLQEQTDQLDFHYCELENKIQGSYQLDLHQSCELDNQIQGSYHWHIVKPSHMHLFILTILYV